MLGASFHRRRRAASTRLRGGAWAIRAAALAALGVLVCACTTVTIVGPGEDGERVTRRHVALGISVDDASVSRTIRLRGVGFFRSADGVAIGAHAADLALLGDDCRAVLWTDTPEDARVIAALVEDIAGACVASVH